MDNKKFKKLSREAVDAYLQYDGVRKSTELKASHKRVLAAIIFATENSEAYHSGTLFVDRETLKNLAGVGTDTLLSAIKVLENHGLIRYIKGKKGTGKASSYTVNRNVLKHFGNVPEQNVLGNVLNKNQNVLGHFKEVDNSLEASDFQNVLEIKQNVLENVLGQQYNIIEDNIRKNNKKEYKKKIENISENSLLKIIEMKTEKIVKETFEKKLLDIVEKTIRDYLDRNLESIVERVCGKENAVIDMSVAHATPDMFTLPVVEDVPSPNGYRQELSLSDFYKENTVIRDTVETENKAGTAHALQINLVKEEKGSEAPQTPVEDKQEPLPSGREQEPFVKEELKDRNGSEAPSKLQLLLIAISADYEIYDFFERRVFDTLGSFNSDLTTKMTHVNTMSQGCNAYFQARRSTSTFFPDEKKRNYVRMLLHKYLNEIVKATLSPESIAKHSQKKGAEAVEESARLRKKFQEQYLQSYELEKDK